MIPQKKFKKKTSWQKFILATDFFMCEDPEARTQSIATTTASVTVYIFTIFFY